MWIRKFEFLANTSNLIIERIKPCIQLCYITFHSLYLNEFQKSFHSKNEFFFFPPPLISSSHMELLIQKEKFVQDVEYREMVS